MSRRIIIAGAAAILAVLTLAQQIKQDMAQEAVSVELNGALYII